MTRFLTLDEVLEIHAEALRTTGGEKVSRTSVCWSPALPNHR